MSFELPELPYAYDALEPAMSSDTLKVHHDKHHAKYINTLNKLISDGSRYADMQLVDIITAAYDANDLAVFNNAGQSWNHSFFWNCMTPNGGGAPEGELAGAVKEKFETIDGFRNAFVEAGIGQFGSGWVWLVRNGAELEIMSTPNAETPFLRGLQPLLVCDVWEHAYYLDYKNERGRFLQNFLDHLVNWDFVAERYQSQGEGNIAAGVKYQRAQHAFAASGEVAAQARDAADALDGPEGQELEAARRNTAQRGR